jgi:hypothetical protein
VTASAQWIVGILLLFLGRKLFWFFVGAVGFFWGVQLAGQFASGQSELILLLIAVALGIVCAMLSVVLQRLAVALAGWFAGGLLATRLAVGLGWSHQPALWIAFLIGAIAAAIVVSLLFDWALIILSALTGATVIAEALPLETVPRMIVATLLFAMGVLVQAKWLTPPGTVRANRTRAD